MRVLLSVIIAAFIAGCATTPPTTAIKVYDQKTNTYRYASKPADNEFVGTSAVAPASKKPTWYKFGHP